VHHVVKVKPREMRLWCAKGQVPGLPSIREMNRS
jgi:hypothetical protein